MTLLYFLLLGVVLVALVVAVRVRRVRTLARLAERIRALRRASLEEPSHAPVGNDELHPAGSLPLYQAASRELAEQGCEVLGDMVEKSSAGKTNGVARWFVGLDGTICGWFAALSTEKGLSPVRFLFSESVTPGVYFITYSGASSVRVAHPPSIQRIEVAIDQGLAAALAGHRAQISQSPHVAAGLRSVATVDEAIALLRRLRAESARWRAAQPADQLMQADLQLILGQRYVELAPSLLVLLRSA